MADILNKIHKYEILKSDINTIIINLNNTVNDLENIRPNLKNIYNINEDITPIVSNVEKVKNKISETSNYLKNTIIPSINNTIRKLTNDLENEKGGL